MLPVPGFVKSCGFYVHICWEGAFYFPAGSVRTPILNVPSLE